MPDPGAVGPPCPSLLFHPLCGWNLELFRPADNTTREQVDDHRQINQPPRVQMYEMPAPHFSPGLAAVKS